MRSVAMCRPFCRPSRRRARVAAALTVVVTALLAALAVVSPPVTAPASAEIVSDAVDPGYPWADAADVNSAGNLWAYGTCPTTSPNCWTRLDDGVRYAALDPWGYFFRNCTSYVAWRFSTQNGYTLPRALGHAGFWRDRFAGKVDNEPRPGAIAEMRGHVAYVEEVNGDRVRLSQYNNATPHDGQPGKRGTYVEEWVARGSYWYIHVQDLPTSTPTTPTTPPKELAKYAGRLVQWKGDTKAKPTTWFVTPDLKRLWVPDAATLTCLRKRYSLAGKLPGATLDRLPDQKGQWVPCGDVMQADRVLRRGMSLKSVSGKYQFVLQGDGNLVLYGPTKKALWANNRFDSDRLIMQGDGNLVTYRDSGSPTWASNTVGRGGQLVVQNDGNVVVYAKGGGAVWATNTTGRR